MKKKSLLLIVIAISFSLQLISQGIPTDWYLDEVNPGADISLYRENTTIYEGTYSCKMVLLTTEVPYLFSYYYNVSEGSPYTFSIWYLDNDTRGSLKVYADFIDNQGEPVYGEEPVYSEDGEDWQNITWSGEVPAGAVQGQVWIKFYDDPGFVDEAVIYIDAASFEVDGSNLVSNASFEEWDIVSVPETADEPSIRIFPNPVAEYLNIEGADYDRIEISNIFGQIVFTADVMPGQKIETEELTAGMYILNVFKDNKFKASAKLVKE